MTISKKYGTALKGKNNIQNHKIIRRNNCENENDLRRVGNSHNVALVC